MFLLLVCVVTPVTLADTFVPFLFAMDAKIAKLLWSWDWEDLGIGIQTHAAASNAASNNGNSGIFGSGLLGRVGPGVGPGNSDVSDTGLLNNDGHSDFSTTTETAARLLQQSDGMGLPSSNSGEEGLPSTSSNGGSHSLLATLMAQYFPTVTLILVNGTLVPYFVFQISHHQRFWRKQRVVYSSLFMNYSFMFSNLVLIPLFGVDSLQTFLYFVARGEWVHTLITTGSAVSGSNALFVGMSLHKQVVRWRFFALKYLISTICITSATQILQAPQIMHRVVHSWTAVTNRDLKEAHQSFDFDYGYWY